MAKFDKRVEARAMRKRGQSIGVIAERLRVSKSSVSIWCRDIELTKKQKETLYTQAIKAGHKGRMMGAEMNRKKRLENVEMFQRLAQKEVGTISERDLLMIGTALYWAEGSKTGSRFMFINSDPAMIQLMYRFLKDGLKISKSRFRATIQINETHRPRINKILSFWSSLLHLPLDRFGNTYFIKTVSKKVYDNHDSYYGILRLSVDNGSQIQYKMLGLIDVLKGKK